MDRLMLDGRVDNTEIHKLVSMLRYFVFRCFFHISLKSQQITHEEIDAGHLFPSPARSGRA
jgi:hypothetical protein